VIAYLGGAAVRKRRGHYGKVVRALPQCWGTGGTQLGDVRVVSSPGAPVPRIDGSVGRWCWRERQPRGATDGLLGK